MKQIIVYSKPKCMQCKMTQEFLKDNKVDFIAIDVTQDGVALNKIKLLGYQSLPVVYVDEMTHWFGFRPERLEGLVNDRI